MKLRNFIKPMALPIRSQALLIVILALVELILFVTNFRPGTFLVGWDNLYPELNFSANLSRNIFSVWQEYRGLGLPDGMVHAANLPHTALLFILSQALPLNLLRYIFIFSMHFLGGVGAYFLLRRLLKPSKLLIPLAGALFYLLNIASVQIFYAPLEAFTVHFAALPWLAYLLFLYFDKPSRKSLLLFILASIFFLPQAFIPQLFIAYLVLAAVIMLHTLRSKGHSARKHVLLVALAIFAINAFWILPYFRSLPATAKTVTSAKINQMSSEDIFLKNQTHGNLADVVFLKGFMLDVQEYDRTGKSGYIMEPWREHLREWHTQLLSLLFAAIATMGLATTVRERRKALGPFLIAGLISFVALANDVPGLHLFNELIRIQFPVLGEAFRFAFTKFSILFVLCYTTFFALGIEVLSGWRARFPKPRIFIPLVIALFVILYTLPSFRGNFFFDSLRLSIGSEYFQVIEFFKQEGANTRIATFPQPSLWNWRFHDDGYRGSGFLWYGIEQPMLDRAFDPWSNKNENYYWEISHALYSQNQELFEKVLEKYRVQWLLVDQNVINPSSPKALYLNELEKAATSPKFNLAQTFGNIQIYKANLETPATGFVFLAQNLPSVAPVYSWNNLDTAYLDYGNYASPLGDSSLATRNSIYYPFRSLFTGKEQRDVEFTMKDDGGFFVLKAQIPSQFKNHRVEIPKANAEDLLAFPQRAYTKGGYLYIHIPKQSGNLARNINPVKLELPPCAHSKDGVVELTSKVGATCSISVPAETLPHSVSYLITVENQNVTGKPIVFWLENLNSRKADIETNLPRGKELTQSFFVQPPMDPFSQGYTLHFDNISIGKEEVVNTIGEIQIQPLPFDFLRSIKLVPPVETPSVPITNTTPNITHPNPALYEVEVDEGPFPTTLVLSQGYDEGWKAYLVDSRLATRDSLMQMALTPFLGQEIKEHVLVNNWANGWQLDQSQTGKTIVILYLPQYLEFFGFLLLLGFGISLIVWRKRAILPLR